MREKFFRPVKFAKCLSNIVLMVKNNRKLRICIDLRDFNPATPKDVYVMTIASMLVDSIANNELLSFMDGFFWYNQIKIVERGTTKVHPDARDLLVLLNGS